MFNMLKKKSKSVSPLALFFIILTMLFAMSVANAEPVGTLADLQTALADENLTEVIVSNVIALPDGTILDGNGKTVRVETPYVKEDGTLESSPSSMNVFELANNSHVTIKNMTIMGGYLGGYGAIYSRGYLTMENVNIVRSNRAIDNSGTIAILKNCNFSLNVARSAAAIWSGSGADLILDGCSFTKNRSNGGSSSGGGAIGISGSSSSLYANNTIFANNATQEIGGAINIYDGNVYLMNCTFVGNGTEASSSYGGGIGKNGGKLYAVNCILVDNYAQIGGSVARKDFGIYSGSSNIGLFNCLYGSSDSAGTNCKTDTLNETFSSYVSEGIIRSNGTLSSSFTHPELFEGDNEYDLYPALDKNSPALTGGIATYFDYSDISDIKMGYGDSENITALGELTVPSSNNKVTTYFEGGTRNEDIIGVSDVAPDLITTWEQLATKLANGGTVTLTQDIASSSTDNELEIPEGVTAILDLNGHIINRNNFGRSLWIEGDLTITDSNPNAEHEPAITYTNPITDETVTVKGGIITGANYQNTIRVSYGGALTLNGGSITGNTARAIYLAGSTFNMNGGTISNNVTDENAPGVWVYEGATMNMTRGVICHNVTTNGNGAGVYLYNNQSTSSTLNISGGSIVENKSSKWGAGICVDNRGYLMMSGNPVVIENYKGEIPDNVHGPSNMINVCEPLIDGARIGITTSEVPSGNSKVVFTNSYKVYNSADNPSNYFVSDRSDEAVVFYKNQDKEACVARSYTVTVTSDGNGTASANVTSGIYGTEVTLTATPTNAVLYRFKEWQVLSGDVTIENNKFRIGTSNVEVKAIFEEEIIEVSTWSELQTAFTMGGSIKLTQDIEATSGCSSISTGNTVILDLNGYIIDGKGFVDTIITVDGYSAKLTINDSNSSREHSPAFIYTNPFTSGDVTVNGGIITGGKDPQFYAAGVFVNKGECIMNGGSIVGNIASRSSGCGVYVRQFATFTMNDGQIAGNYAAGDGGGVNLYYGATFNMNGGSIKHNVAGGKGGGVFLWNNQSGYYETFNMNGGSIIENKSTGNGGGICIDQRGVVCVSGNAVVIGNKKGEDDCNIQGGRINVVGNLTDGASIGFTGDNFSFTSGYSTYNDGDDPALYFVSDNPKSIVVLDYYGTEAALTPLYSITVTSDENGTATANPLTGLSGTEVTLTVTPNDGYIFKEWQVISGGVTITDNKFTIKSSDVEIKAIFKEIIVEVSTWAELQAALNMDGRVRLTQDIIATSGCSSLNVNNEVSLDLNGYIIDGKGLVAPVIYVDRYGVLTINDSRPNQEHIPAFTYTNPITSGDVVVNGGIITGGLNEDNWGAGVEVYRGECTMNGGSIVKNITNGGEGAGVFVHSTGVFTMNDGLIAGNHASGSGGGVNMYDRTTFNMIGGSIKHNTSDANGGGFYLWNNQSGYYEVLNMSGGTIEENKCTGNGGGICIDTRGRVYFSGNPVITGNKKGDTNNNVYGSFGISGTLLDGASIGVTTKQSPLTGGTQTFTGGYNEYNSGDDPANYFVSDFDKALVTLDFQNEACLERAYEVILTTDEHGTATANPTLGLNGTEVTLTATPNNGYTFKEWQVISGGVTITDNKFTFGSSDVEVKAIFEATTMLGDLNDDKTITILDVRLLLQAYINSSSSTEWTEQQLAIMDINDDKKIDILDVRLLLQMYINN